MLPRSGIEGKRVAVLAILIILTVLPDAIRAQSRASASIGVSVTIVEGQAVSFERDIAFANLDSRGGAQHVSGWSENAGAFTVSGSRSSSVLVELAEPEQVAGPSEDGVEVAVQLLGSRDGAREEAVPLEQGQPLQLNAQGRYHFFVGGDVASRGASPGVYATLSTLTVTYN